MVRIEGCFLIEIKLFVSDLDGTLLGTPTQNRLFSNRWLNLAPHKRPVLTYSTGRPLKNTLQALSEYKLLSPDYIISDVGTQVHDVRSGKRLDEFAQYIQPGWDEHTIEDVINRLKLDIRKQPDAWQSEFKSSWYLDHVPSDIIKQIQKALDASGVKTTVVYSSNRDLDVLPLRANKGGALRWMMHYLQVQPHQTLVAGDSGNDQAMFLIEGIHGIIVNNAQPELNQFLQHPNIYFTGASETDGVMEGLTHFKVF